MWYAKCSEENTNIGIITCTPLAITQETVFVAGNNNNNIKKHTANLLPFCLPATDVGLEK